MLKLQTKNELLTEMMEEQLSLKRVWGSLRCQLSEPNKRDEIYNFVALWSKYAEIKALIMADWIGKTSSDHYHWKIRYGKFNQNFGNAPPDH